MLMGGKRIVIKSKVVPTGVDWQFGNSGISQGRRR